MKMLKKATAILLVLSILCPFCSALGGDLHLPGKTRVIEDEAFYNLESADTVYLPWGLETISSKAFANSETKAVYIPSTVYIIADDAFQGCNLTIFAEEYSCAYEFAMAHNIPWQNDETQYAAEQEEGIPYSDDGIFSFRGLELDLTELISAEGESDAETLDLIQQYNLLAEEENAVITAYNEAVRNYYTHADNMISFLSDISVQEESGMDLYTVDSLQAVFDQQIQEVLESGSFTDAQIAEDGQTVILTTDQGRACYIEQTNSQLSITASPPSAVASSATATTYHADWIEKANQWMEKASDFSQVHSLFMDAFDLLVDGLLPQLQEIAQRKWDQFERINKNLTMSRAKAKAAEIGKTRSGQLASIKNIRKWMGKAARFLPFIDIPFTINDMIDSYRKALELLEIYDHGHPCSEDQVPNDRRELAINLGIKVKMALSLYESIIIADLLSLALYLMPAVSLPVQKALAAYAVSNGLLAEKLYNQIKADDPKLHSSITGTVTDAETKAIIPDVAIYYPDGTYIMSNSLGDYLAYCLPGMVKLAFKKDPWAVQNEDIQVIEGKNVKRDVELKPQKYGTITGYIKDEYGEILDGALAKCGDQYSAPYGDTQFRYSLTLPVGTHTIIFSRYGYISEQKTIDIQEGTQEYSPELKWKFGLRGTVWDEAGEPVPGAQVSIYTGGFKAASDYITETDENGFYKIHLDPGIYGVRIRCDGYISDDLYMNRFDCELTVEDQPVKKQDAMMINTNGKYCASVIISSGPAAWWSPYSPVLIGNVSWGEYSVMIDETHGSFYCVSDTPNVTLAGNCELRDIGTGNTFNYWYFVRTIDDLRSHPEFEFSPGVREDGSLY